MVDVVRGTHMVLNAVRRQVAHALELAAECSDPVATSKDSADNCLKE